MVELTKAEKDKLITDNLKLAGFLAHQYSRSNAIPYNDLYQEGCIGLIKAAQKFKILHNRFEGFSGNDITIQDALGERFNYTELMNG